MRAQRDGRSIDAPLQALGAVAARLRCPNCAASLSLIGRALVCSNGHSFDTAREGYVTLAPPRAKLAGGDSAEMVAARGEFLSSGRYEAIAAAISAAAHDTLPGPKGRDRLALDLGAGTGYYLAALLRDRDRRGQRGLALDTSRPALRRATRAHPQIAAVLCDVWRELPVLDGCAELVLNVFAPRNAAEIARVLAPAGTLIVVTPAPSHLRELVDALGLIDVGADKQARLHASLAPRLEPIASRRLEFTMQLDREQVHSLVAMGPSARHITPERLRSMIAGLPAITPVGASVVVESFRAGGVGARPS